MRRKLNKTEQKLIGCGMWSKSYCVDAVGQKSNWYVINDIQKAIFLTIAQNVGH